MPDAKDLNDGKEWSDMDLRDQRAAVEAGDTNRRQIEECCRVAAKRESLTSA